MYWNKEEHPGLYGERRTGESEAAYFRRLALQVFAEQAMLEGLVSDDELDAILEARDDIYIRGLAKIAAIAAQGTNTAEQVAQLSEAVSNLNSQLAQDRETRKQQRQDAASRPRPGRKTVHYEKREAVRLCRNEIEEKRPRRLDPLSKSAMARQISAKLHTPNTNDGFSESSVDMHLTALENDPDWTLAAQLNDR